MTSPIDLHAIRTETISDDGRVVSTIFDFPRSDQINRYGETETVRLRVETQFYGKALRSKLSRSIVKRDRLVSIESLTFSLTGGEPEDIPPVHGRAVALGRFSRKALGAQHEAFLTEVLEDFPAAAIWAHYVRPRYQVIALPGGTVAKSTNSRARAIEHATDHAHGQPWIIEDTDTGDTIAY